MLVTTSTRHGSISDQTRAKLEAKVEKLGRLFDQITAISIKVELENKDKPAVEVLISQNNGPDIVTSVQTDELMASMDGALHKLEMQLRKNKEKTVDRHHTPGELPEPAEKA